MINAVAIPEVETVEQLRNAVVLALNRLVLQANKVIMLDAKSGRVVNVADPSEAADAVNLRTVRKLIAEATDGLVGTTTESTTTITGASVIIYEVTLSSASTEITHAAPSAEGDLLLVVITQDSTGGRVITWNSTNFDSDTATQLNYGSTEETSFMFAGRSDNKWHQIGLQRLP